MLRSRQFFYQGRLGFLSCEARYFNKGTQTSRCIWLCYRMCLACECLSTWGLAGFVRGGGMIPDSTGPDRMRHEGTRTRGDTAVHAHVLAWPCLLAAFCNKCLIWFEFPQLQEMLKINFLFQVSAMLGSFNITSHETYYITAVIVPGILSTDLL